MKGEETGDTLRRMVEGQFASLQEKYSSFPKTASRRMGTAGQNNTGGTFEQSQQVVFRESSCGDFFDFIARVKQANPSVHIGAFKLTRSTRPSGPVGTAAPPGEEDRWTCDVTFLRYVSPSAIGAGGKTGAKSGTANEETIEETSAAESATDGVPK